MRGVLAEFSAADWGAYTSPKPPEPAARPQRLAERNTLNPLAGALAPSVP